MNDNWQKEKIIAEKYIFTFDEEDNIVLVPGMKLYIDDTGNGKNFVISSKYCSYKMNDSFKLVITKEALSPIIFLGSDIAVGIGGIVYRDKIYTDKFGDIIDFLCIEDNKTFIAYYS